MGTQLFERMRLRCIAFVRKEIRSCKERDLLGCSGVGAFEGGRDFVKLHLIQMITPGVLQWNGLSTTADVPIVQSRKHACQIIGLSVTARELSYSKRVQLMPWPGRKALIFLSNPLGTLLQVSVSTGTCLQDPLSAQKVTFPMAC